MVFVITIRKGVLCISRLFVYFVVCVFCLTGCEHSAGQESKEAPVSGSAVSGQAMTVQSDDSRYTYCSDKKLYYIESCYNEDSVLVECDRKSSEKRKLSIPHLHQICYADNAWVYYTTDKYIEGMSVVEKVWRIPVDRASFQADETAAEMVLKLEDKYGLVTGRSHVGNRYRGVLCDGKYIVYCGCDEKEENVRIYDIEAKTYRDVEDREIDSTIEYLVLRDGNLVFGDEKFNELCCIHLDEKRETVIANEKYFDEKYGVVSFVGTATDEDVFWTTGMSGGYGKKNGGVWQYHFADDNNIRLISNEEIRDIIEKEVSDCSCGRKKPKWHEDGIFVSRSRLYVQVAVQGKREKDISCHHYFVVSKTIGKPDDVLCVEKELNQWLANPKARQKTFVKKYDGIYGQQSYGEKSVFMNRGFIMAMTDDACLMCLENMDQKKNSLACYYFDKEESPVFVKAKDVDGLLYLFDRENTIVTGDFGQFVEDLDIEGRMPNNYGVKSMQR